MFVDYYAASFPFFSFFFFWLAPAMADADNILALSFYHALTPSRDAVAMRVVVCVYYLLRPWIITRHHPRYHPKDKVYLSIPNQPVNLSIVSTSSVTAVSSRMWGKELERKGEKAKKMSRLNVWPSCRGGLGLCVWTHPMLSGHTGT